MEYTPDTGWEGHRPLRDIILRAVWMAQGSEYGTGLPDVRVRTGIKAIDTSETSVALGDLSQITASLAAFVDEQEQGGTWREILEGVLLPLGLHIVQRDGHCLVYDTDAAYEDGFSIDTRDETYTPIAYWTSDAQTLGAAERAGAATVTYSPGARPVLIPPEITVDRNVFPVSLRRRFMSAIATSYDPRRATIWPSFEMSRTSGGTSAWTAPSPACGTLMRWFEIRPVMGGASECSGFWLDPVNIQWRTEGDAPKTLRPVAAATSRWCDPEGGGLLRFRMEMLWDARFNPFEDTKPKDTDLRNVADAKVWEETCNTVRCIGIPLRILLLDPETGQPTHYVSNIDQARRLNAWRHNSQITPLEYSGRWKPVDAALNSGQPQCYAEFYPKGDTSLLGQGWMACRPTIGMSWSWADGPDCPQTLFDKIPDGMYIKMPPHAGRITVEVLDGIRIGTYSMLCDLAAGKDPKTLPECGIPSGLTQMRWRLIRGLELDRVDTDFRAPDTDDQTAEAKAYRSGSDTVSVDTMLGHRVGFADAGTYRLGSSGRPLSLIERSGRINRPMEILAASVLSQYAVKRITLQGEAAAHRLPWQYPVMTDANCPVPFIIASRRLDCRSGTEDLTLLQLHPSTLTDAAQAEGGGKPHPDPDPDPRTEYNWEAADPWSREEQRDYWEEDQWEPRIDDPDEERDDYDDGRDDYGDDYPVYDI